MTEANANAAKNGDTVRIHYTGKLTDGTTFDSSIGREPLEFTLGAGQIIKGLEAGLMGMAAGDSKTVQIEAADAYGAHNPAHVQKVARSQIPADIDLQLGMQLGAQTPTGEQISFTVVDISDEEIVVDANHPLAGKDLVFEVELIEIV